MQHTELHLWHRADDGLGVELVRTTIEDGSYTDDGWLLHKAERPVCTRSSGFVVRSEYLMERLGR